MYDSSIKFREKLRTRSMPVISAAVATTMLVGCSANGDGGAAAGADPNASFSFGDVTSIDSLDPARAPNSNAYRWLYPIYDRLVMLDPDAQLEPGLAEEWETLSDGTIVFKLRTDVKFQDGTKLDADAVVENIERYKKLPEATSTVSVPASEISKVEAVDEKTVRVHVTKPDSGLLYEFAGALGMMMSPGSMKEDPNNSPVGSGPYEAESFDPGQSVKLKRFEDHWEDDAAGVEEMTIRAMTDADSRLSALQTGEMDMAFLEPRQINQVKSGSLKLEQNPSFGIYNLYPNIKSKPLDNVKVRKAIMHSLNRDAIVENLVYGAGEPSPQLFGPTSSIFVEKLDELYPQSDKKVKQLLADIDQKDLTMDMLVLNRTFDQQLAEAIQQMLNKNGFKISLKVVDPSRLDLYMDGETELWVGRWNGRADPAQTIEGVTGPNGILNASQTAPKELTKLLDKISKAEPGEGRDDLLRKASTVVTEQALTFPLYSSDSLYASKECVLNFTPSVTGVDDYRYLQMGTC